MRAHLLLPTLGLLAALSAACGTKEGCEVTAHCFEGSTCEEGSCQPVDPTAPCSPRVGANDGCDAYHVCANVAGTGSESLELRCVEADACGSCNSIAQDHPGACNNGVWEEKASGICLPGRCSSSEDCGTGRGCVYPTGDLLGFCTGGSAGDLCVRDSDCFFDECDLSGGELVGVCLAPSLGDGDGDGDGDGAGDGDGDLTDCVANGGFCYSGSFCSDVGAESVALLCDDFNDVCCQ